MVVSAQQSQNINITRSSMRKSSKTGLLVCFFMLTCSIHEVHSLQRHGYPPVWLNMVGGSQEDITTAGSSVDNDTPADDSKAAFLRSAVNDVRSQSGVGKSIKDRLAQMQRPKLNIGLGSEAMDKFKTQSSRFLEVALTQLLKNNELTRPAVYALALLGSSCGFYLFLYFITVGYVCGVTLPVLVAMIVYNVSQEACMI